MDPGDEALSWQRLLGELLKHHRGKLVGASTGLVLAVMVMRVGPWWTAFIVLSVYIGFRLGQQVDEKKESLLEVIERYLPPGQGR
jgi:uncharacterized membrane protein